MPMLEGQVDADPEQPGAKQIGTSQPPDLSADDDQDLLTDVVRMVGAHQVAKISLQRRQRAPQQLFERVPVGTKVVVMQ